MLLIDLILRAVCLGHRFGLTASWDAWDRRPWCSCEGKHMWSECSNSMAGLQDHCPNLFFATCLQVSKSLFDFRATPQRIMCYMSLF